MTLHGPDAVGNAALIFNAVNLSKSALVAAENFISGFEGDELQDGIPELLATIRAAIGGAA